jgi:hypothetical protein
MHWGEINLFCSICGAVFRLNLPLKFAQTKGTMHHKEFGYVCDKECWSRAELKYARMILGKDDA